MSGSRPYIVIPLENEFGVFVQGANQGSKLEHIACFFDESFANDYVRIKNDEVDSSTWDKPAHTNGKDHARNVISAAISQSSQLQNSQGLLGVEADLHPSVALTLSTMRAAAKGSHIVQISHNDLAKRTGLGDGSVANAVRRLQSLGLIMVAEPGSALHPATYQLAETKPINV